MSTTSEQIRGWTGPAVLTYGFRPFFLGAAAWAAMAMVVWVPMLAGVLTFPTAFDPVSWHAHEFLFGYLGAVVAGFLLTAVPNWTGRLPIVGWPLGGLFALWLAGRIVIALSMLLPQWLVAVADLSLPTVLGIVIAREIVAGRNWRNLMVLGMLVTFTTGNALFHWEAARGDYAAQGYGLRLGLGAAMMMIAVIGGRIVPSFTRNWLVRRGGGRLPVPPMQRFDRVALLVLLLGLGLWVATPEGRIAGLVLVLAGGLHVLRLLRWSGDRTWTEPLVLVLHVAYAFLPLGALAVGSEILSPGLLGAGVAQHLWMAGAIGLMTLAVMTRATLGHTGQDLTAGWGTAAIYICMVAAALGRVLVGLLPTWSSELVDLSGAAWITAFVGFALLYGRLLLRRREAN